MKKITVNDLLFTATFTKAADNLMFEINAKIVLIAQSFFYRPEKHFIAFNTFAAPGAHQVMMVPFFSVVINDMVAGFAFQDTTEMLENIQIAVDGGFIHAGHLFMNMGNYFFRCQVRFGIMEIIRHQFTLGS
jgi:hypothetical protein